MPDVAKICKQDLLGQIWPRIASGAASCQRLPCARPEHENSWKGVHGGVILTLLDVAMSSAARSLDVTCIGCTTVEMKTNFLAAGRGRIVAAGHAQRAGRSLIFAEGEAKDAAGKLLAKGSGTFKLLYPKGTDD